MFRVERLQGGGLVPPTTGEDHKPENLKKSDKKMTLPSVDYEPSPFKLYPWSSYFILTDLWPSQITNNMYVPGPGWH